jgi:hypothetical protein
MAEKETPPVNAVPIMVRVPPAELKPIDAWIAEPHASSNEPRDGSAKPAALLITLTTLTGIVP